MKTLLQENISNDQWVTTTFSWEYCYLFELWWRIFFIWSQFFWRMRSVWKYQRGNQIPYTEEQTTQWPKEKVQKDKQWSTKHTHKTEDRVTRTPLKTGGELRCPLHCNIVWSYPLSLLYKATFSYPILYLSFTWQHCLILSFISPLQGNIFISNPLSLLYIATLSDPILYLSFTRQHFHIQSREKSHDSKYSKYASPKHSS
jgi:hypothetical protein